VQRAQRYLQTGYKVLCNLEVLIIGPPSIPLCGFTNDMGKGSFPPTTSLSTMSNGAHSPNTTQDTGYTTSRVLDDIKTATDCISQATTQRYVDIREVSPSLYRRSLSWLCSEYLQRLSEESERVWREIKLLPPVELVAVWDHVICYREYVHVSIRIAFAGDQYNESTTDYSILLSLPSTRER